MSAKLSLEVGTQKVPRTQRSSLDLLRNFFQAILDTLEVIGYKLGFYVISNLNIQQPIKMKMKMKMKMKQAE